MAMTASVSWLVSKERDKLVLGSMICGKCSEDGLVINEKYGVHLLKI